MEKISFGNIVKLQAFIVTFLSIFWISIAFFVHNMMFDYYAWGILLCVVGFLLITYRVFSRFADVYVFENNVIYKKLFKTHKRHLIDIKSLGSGNLPTNVYIEFIDEKKVYFKIEHSKNYDEDPNKNSEATLKRLKKRLQLA